MTYILTSIAQGVTLWALSTVVFDMIHWLLHVFEDSRFPLLRTMGGLHGAHHEFLDTELVLDATKSTDNIVKHMLPEMIARILVTAAGLVVLEMWIISIVILSHVLFFGVQAYLKGEDMNHFEPTFLKSPRPFPFVDPSYHLLHHKHPRQYYASMIRLFDIIFGTGCQLEGKRILMTGGSGALGAPLKAMLEKNATVTALKFGQDWSYSDYSIFDTLLPETDIVILAHGSKTQDAMAANCDSFVTIIEKTIARARRGDRFLEVWALGSEIECHPHFGIEELRIYKESKVSFARHARTYFHSRVILYRHIVPSAFSSRMGPGLISGKTAARVMMFFIKRGFHYVPVSYTGIALLNYPFYLFGPRPEGRATFASANPRDQPHT